MRNIRNGAEAADLEQGDDLVIRPFRIKLKLAVLVGNAQRLGRGLAAVAGFALAGDILAEAFRPKLAEPVCHILETVRIRHNDLHIDVQILHADVLKHRL